MSTSANSHPQFNMDKPIMDVDGEDGMSAKSTGSMEREYEKGSICLLVHHMLLLEGLDRRRLQIRMPGYADLIIHVESAPCGANS
jgi:hypothetical protein